MDNDEIEIIADCIWERLEYKNNYDLLKYRVRNFIDEFESGNLPEADSRNAVLREVFPCPNCGGSVERSFEVEGLWQCDTCSFAFLEKDSIENKKERI